MAKIMEHRATVTEVVKEENRVEVEMVVDSACSSCKAKAACGTGESDKRCVSVWEEYPDMYQVGDEVTIYIEQYMGTVAVMYCYILPFFMMILSLFITNHFALGDLISGISALVVCAVYYIVLFFLRKRVEKIVVFKIKKQLF